RTAGSECGVSARKISDDAYRDKAAAGCVRIRCLNSKTPREFSRTITRRWAPGCAGRGTSSGGQYPVQLILALQTFLLQVFGVEVGRCLEALLDSHDLVIDLVVVIEELGESVVAFLELQYAIAVFREF